MSSVLHAYFCKRYIQRVGEEFIVHMISIHRSVTRGDNVKYGGGEIKGASAMVTDADIGDLVQHTYTVSVVLSCLWSAQNCGRR